MSYGTPGYTKDTIFGLYYLRIDPIRWPSGNTKLMFSISGLSIFFEVTRVMAEGIAEVL
jgi:hypothetical protein